MSGIIQGYNSNDINIKGPRRMINVEPPEMNIKSSKLHLDQPDFNIKGSRRLDISEPNLNLISLYSFLFFNFIIFIYID